MSRSSAAKTAKTLSRRTARLAAVQALYVMQASDAPIQAVLTDLAEGRLGGVALEDHDGDDVELPLAAPDTALLTRLVTGAAAHREDLESMVAGCLTGAWKRERLEPTLAAILTLGAEELLHHPDTPPRVVVDEYVGLAKAFYGDTEAGMVNAALDRLSKTLRGTAEARTIA